MSSGAWWIVRSALKYGSPLLAPFERKAVARLGKTEPEHPCIFILGPPRSGSTIVYQLITSLLEVAYVDNLANMARYQPVTGMELSKRFFGDKAHRNFESNYGTTREGGLHAPAEALYFYKWFPKDRHHTEVADLTETQLDQFRSTTFAMIRKMQKPLVIKNLSFSVRLPVLREALPSARYIVVRRDPFFTAQSILQGMRDHRVPMDRVWSILPKGFESLQGLPPEEIVVRQVHMIENQMAEELEKMGKDQYLILDYETLSDSLEENLQAVMNLCSPSLKRRVGDLPSVQTQNRNRIDEKEGEPMRTLIHSLTWKLQHL
ncbi:MAG: sulfotransferase [Bacteroidales bacterium]